ncbi:MAG: hypothetical protein ACRCYO_09575 [Bacteroidia bacterium]
MNQEGFWYSVGRGFHTLFEGLEWTYDHLTPNKILIVVGFVCFAWWIKMQSDYNRKAEETGGLK